MQQPLEYGKSWSKENFYWWQSNPILKRYTQWINSILLLPKYNLHISCICLGWDRCIERIRLKNIWKNCDSMGYITFLYIWLLSKRIRFIKSKHWIKKTEHYRNKIWIVVKETSQHKTIWICYQTHKISTWKKIFEDEKMQRILSQENWFFPSCYHFQSKPWIFSSFCLSVSLTEILV